LQAECTGIDANTKVLHCQDSELCLDVPYDNLVVAVGAQPNTFGIPGVEENAMFLKELDHALAVRKLILEKMERANLAIQAGRADEAEKLLSIVVVGGGPTGVEFAAEVVDFINTDVRRSFPNIVDKMKVTLVEALPQLLPMFGNSIGEGVSKHLSSIGVDVRTETMVKNVDSHRLSLGTKSGEDKKLDYGVLVWVAGIGARPITKTLATAFGQSNPRGIEVDEKLCVKGANGNDVFAFGDCAVSGNPLTAQVASQQGKYLGNVFRNGGASASKPFIYDHQGTMAYVGKGEGVAELTVPTADFSFWRELATCPQGWLKEEHRNLPVEKPNTWKITVQGLGGFAIWRGVYFVKLFSYSNRFNVTTDWVRNFFFGRVIASSVQSRQ
jgi:NADH:ubiquinone reductase (non-electrogenic)